jgi:putative copper resistance protein D
MQMIIPEYINSWILSYGQALLIKHLLIVPVMVFALFNGFYMKSKLAKKDGYDPERRQVYAVCD